MTNKLLIVHLSDIHIDSRGNEILTRANIIAATTFRRLPEVDTVILVFTGDIAYSGTRVQYEMAEDFINKIRNEILGQKANLKFEVFVCPGNHDCNFELDNETRDAVIGKIRTMTEMPSDSIINTATSIQAEFFEFRDLISKHSWTHKSPLSWQSTLKVGNHCIGVRSLNVAWMSEIKEKQGTLNFPALAVKPFKGEHVDLSITLLHHPYNWFGQSSYRLLQETLRKESQIVFTGHEHVQNVGEISDLRSNSSVFVEGGVLFESKYPKNSKFNTLLVNLEKLEYLPELYSLEGERYELVDEIETWGSLRIQSDQSENTCSLNQDFKKLLSDPGANFTHPTKKNLELDDFYIWPDLQYLDDPATIKKNVLGSYFVDVQNLNAGIFIRGDEKAGKTTLLFQYFNRYFERGYLPLYFRGTWFSRSHVNAPLKALKFALEKQYDRKNHGAYQQASKSQRILLLDDIDSASIQSEHFSLCLKQFFEFFDYIIVTGKDGVASMDLLSIDRIDALRDFSQYEIREFGHKKRFELVCKWAEIGGLHEENSDKWMSSVDKWEKDLTTAVGRQFVPAVPIFLLTLIQSIDSNRTADLQNSAFGHYYQFLITSALQNIGIAREQWAEISNYCSNLAWVMHDTGQINFPKSELLSFNQQYCNEFTHVPFERRLQDLIQASILTEKDGEISFKYPYLYFFYVGAHIADHLHEIEMESVVASLCKNLQETESANILLFACHHTRSPIIYQKIADALDDCFVAKRNFDFKKDAVLLNSLVQTVPSLAYEDRPVRESRSLVRADQDNGSQSFNSVDETNFAITRLYRSMEILGQLLKNHYGQTKNPVKEQLIKKIVDGSMRGLLGIVESFLENSDALLEKIGYDVTNKKEPTDEEIAHKKRLLFDVMGIVTFGFIHKASSCIGSVYLKDNLANTVRNENSLAYKLVEMSFQLDLPDPIPFPKLKGLNSEVEKNVFCQALLRTLALKHLHLFKVSFQDKQRLCEELGIALNKQMALQNSRKR